MSDARPSFGDARFVLTVRPGAAPPDPHASPGVRLAYAKLREDGATRAELAEVVASQDGPASLHRWQWQLAGLERKGVMCYSARDGARMLATLTPMTSQFRPEELIVGPKDRLALSRLAIAHRVGGSLRLESPLTTTRVDIPSPAVGAMLVELSRGTTTHDVTQSVRDVPEAAVGEVLQLLGAAGMLTVASEDGGWAEDDDQPLAQWELHDLLFHARSRGGRHDHPVGSSFRFAGTVPPEPAVKPRSTEHPVRLTPPSAERVGAQEPSFATVLEARRSLRVHGSEPMTVEQLSEFLFRVARVRGTIEATDEPTSYETTSRVYPSGGACYPLELYALVNRCGGLDRGIYHYDPREHLLEPLRASWRNAERIFRSTPIAEHTNADWNVLFVITARFPRVTWTYQSVAYGLILKEVGVLYQTMYLVATAMQLAPCALGTGDSELFAGLIGTRFYEETSVGEFLLGNRGDGE